MPQQYTIHALSQAEKQTLALTTSCISARQDLVAAQNRSFAAYRALRDLQDQAKQAPQGDDFSATMLVLLMNATLEAEAQGAALSDAARESSIMLLFAEKQLSHARLEEAEAQLETDQYLAATATPSPSTPVRRTKYTDCPHGVWRARVDKAFTDYSQIQTLPLPQPLTSTQRHTLTCQNHSNPRAISACECAVRQAFLGPPGSARSDISGRTINLRTERLRWAPENFARCSEAVRGQAAYVFGIVDAMYTSIPR
ncbi:hypothetical protein LTR08_008744 [Meristemomyces frigidus]|nr:hypothetical protein LTR08_008744 [Meristemomyces frigidus]